MDLLINLVLSFKELLIVGIVVGGMFFAVSSIISNDIGWQNRTLRFFGIFTGLNTRELLWMSAGLVKIVFVACVCLFTQRMGLANTALYAALSLLLLLTFIKWQRILIELINAAAVYASLTALDVIIGYFRDINNNPMVLIVYLLLSLFTVLYCVYFYMRGVLDLLKHKLAKEGEEEQQ